MLLLISLILELCISSIRLVFQLGNLLIRLVDAVFPMMAEMPSDSLGSDLRFMRRLNRRVFLLDLMDFAVNAGSEGVTDLADGFIRFKLQLAFALWFFQLILKMKAGFAIAGLFIEDALFLENLVRGQLSRAASRRSCAFSDFLSSFCIHFVGGAASSETGFAEAVSAA